MKVEELLINERQLGNKLSSAVNQSRRADFGLLLSMLSQNVVDQAVFNLPKDEQFDLSKTEELAKRFNVQPAIKFSGTSSSAEQALSMNRLLRDGGLASVKLSHYMELEPVAPRDDKAYIGTEVIGNCEPAVQQRYFGDLPALPEPDVTGLIDVLDQIHGHA